MNFQFKGLQLCSDLGAGYVAVTFICESDSSVVTRCSVQRTGHREENLGAHGWQTPMHVFVPFNLELHDTVLRIVLEPWAVQHMRNSYNYRVALYDDFGAELGYAIVHWKGVPSFRKGSGKSPSVIWPQFEVKQNDEYRTLSPNAADRVDQAGWGLDAATDDDAIVADRQSEIGDSASGMWQEHTEVGAINSSPNVFISDADQEVEEPVRSIPCPLDPSHKIFSNVVFCPVCGKSVR